MKSIDFDSRKVCELRRQWQAPIFDHDLRIVSKVLGKAGREVVVNISIVPVNGLRGQGTFLFAATGIPLGPDGRLMRTPKG